MPDGAVADAWALPMEGLGTIGVPLGVIAVALATAVTEGLRTTMGVPPAGAVAFALAAAAMAAALSLGGEGGDCNIIALHGESWV
jgi:hypothetical protein